MGSPLAGKEQRIWNKQTDKRTPAGGEMRAIWQEREGKRISHRAATVQVRARKGNKKRTRGKGRGGESEGGGWVTAGVSKGLKKW